MNAFPEPSPDDVLARARAAAGGEACARLRTLRLAGTVSAGGLSGPFSQRIDRARGRTSRTFALGPATISTGFDGACAWRRGPDGDVTRQDAAPALRAAVTQAWLDAHGWWSPHAATARYEALGLLEAEGRAHDVVRALPCGGDPVQLWFDRATNLLARTVQPGALGPDTVTRYADHRAVAGARLPFRVTVGTGDARFDRVVVLDRIAADEPIDEAELAAPAAAVDDLRFVDGTDRAAIAVAVIQNTVVVPVEVDGHPLRFVLDSGGVTLVTAETAARLGLHGEGLVQAGGMGPRPQGAGFVRVGRLAVGGAVVLERPLLHVLPLPGASAVLGVPVDGLLGAELFRRLVVRIDYERESLALLRPPAEPAPDWGERLPLTFYAHIPCVDAELDGLAAKFLLDTGNTGAVLLHAWPEGTPREGASAPTTVGWGVGGAIVGRLARGGQLRLGAHRIEAPALRVLEEAHGTRGAPGLAGNLGAAILSRFVVTFDYGCNAAWLAPNARFGAPFRVDRSGLRIHAVDDGFAVMAVMAGSPADEAGLRAGDRIVAVDGAAARGIPLHAQRRAWQERAAGTRVALRVERAGETFDAGFALRDLIPATRGDTAR